MNWWSWVQKLRWSECVLNVKWNYTGSCMIRRGIEVNVKWEDKLKCKGYKVNWYRSEMMKLNVKTMKWSETETEFQS